MTLLSYILFLSLLATGFGATQDDDTIQKEVYIIAGVFGGITVVLLLMIIGLAWTVARLNHEVKSSKATSQPTIPSQPTVTKNPVTTPAMTSARQDNYPAMTSARQDNYPRRQQEHNNRHENHPRQGEYDENMYRYSHTQQEYNRGEDRVDRNSQYSWEPLARRGEENRLPRLSYGQARR